MLENNKLRPTTKDARNYFVEIKNTPPVIESWRWYCKRLILS